VPSFIEIRSLQGEKYGLGNQRVFSKPVALRSHGHQQSKPDSVRKFSVRD
jgi:hypothetical protein